MGWGGRGVKKNSAASPVMAETRQGAWAEGRSDQRWMGTIQEAVTRGRLVADHRRQETGSTPRRENGRTIRRSSISASLLYAVERSNRRAGPTWKWIHSPLLGRLLNRPVGQAGRQPSEMKERRRDGCSVEGVGVDSQ